MEIKTQKFIIEINQNELNILEEELFSLGIWNDDRNSTLNKFHIQTGDFPLLEDIWKETKKFKKDYG